jgi:hypothetical protein
MRSILFLLAATPGLIAQMAPNDAVSLEERIAKDQLTSAEDYLAAAQLMAERNTAEGHLAARELALVAWLMGKPSNLMAQSEDAFLLAIGKSARFAAPGGGDSMPTDGHRLDFLVNPLAPTDNVEALQQERLSPAWRTRPKRDYWANNLHQASGASREAPLTSTFRTSLIKGYKEGRLRTAEDLFDAAKILTRSKDASDLLLANEWAALSAVRGYMPARILFGQTWDRAAKALGHLERYGTMGSQTMGLGVAPGVIRNLGFSGRPAVRP